MRSKGLDASNDSDEPGTMQLKWTREDYAGSQDLVETLVCTTVHELIGGAQVCSD